eukprot:IDg17255t1
MSEKTTEVLPSISTDARETVVCWRREGARLLEEAATSTTLSDAALLVARIAAMSFLLPQLVLFSLSGDYSLAKLTGVASALLAVSSAHLSLCSLSRVVAWPRGRGAATLGAPAAPLLQGSLTLVFFGAITRAALHPPTRWAYPVLAQVVVEPLMGALLVLTSQRMRFRLVYVPIPLGGVLIYYVVSVMRFKTELKIQLPYIDH